MNLLDMWKEEDGLVTIEMAAEIIGIAHSSVSRAADRGKIKAYPHKKKRYLSFRDVLFYKAQRENKGQ